MDHCWNSVVYPRNKHNQNYGKAVSRRLIVGKTSKSAASKDEIRGYGTTGRLPEAPYIGAFRAKSNNPNLVSRSGLSGDGVSRARTYDLHDVNVTL